MQEMYWTAEELVASQDGLCCEERKWEGVDWMHVSLGETRGRLL